MIKEKTKVRRSLIYFIALVSVIGLAVLPTRGQGGGQFEGRTTGNINGQIRYAQGGQPAFNVLVNCESSSGGLIGQETTDRNGRFSFRNINLAQYVITVRLPGYFEERETVALQQQPDEYLQIRLRPDSSTVASVPTTTVMDASVPPEARKEFQKAEELLANKGKDAVEEGIRHLEAALTIYPRFLQAELKLGTLYMDAGRWDEAEKALKQALEIDPKTVNASFALGEIYLRQKKYDEAEKVLQAALAVEPKSPRAHFVLARVYWEKVSVVKDESQWRPPLEKSYQEVKIALEMDPNLADAHLLKGNLYFKVRRAEDALHEFEEYLRLDPKGPFADQTRSLADKIRKALAETKKP
jgi:tetratricopeptide (TPR) repeat protein